MRGLSQDIYMHWARFATCKRLFLEVRPGTLLCPINNTGRVAMSCSLGVCSTLGLLKVAMLTILVMECSSKTENVKHAPLGTITQQLRPTSMHIYIPRRRCAHINCNGSYCADYRLENHDNTVQGVCPLVRGDASNAGHEQQYRGSSGSMRPTGFFKDCVSGSSGTC